MSSLQPSTPTKPSDVSEQGSTPRSGQHTAVTAGSDPVILETQGWPPSTSSPMADSHSFPVNHEASSIKASHDKPNTLSTSKKPGMSANASKATGAAKNASPKTTSKTTNTASKSAKEAPCKPLSAKTPASQTSSSKKRSRAKDVEADGSPAKRPRASTTNKHIRPSRRMPTFQGGPGIALASPDGASTGDFMNFNSTVYEVTLGETEFKFHGHGSVLEKSPKFAAEIRKAATGNRRTPRQALRFDGYDPGAFEQMMQFLYKDRFNLIKQNTTLGRLRELHQLMALAKSFQLPLLQKQVVATFAKSNLMSKITILTFFDWAEDMFYGELDHINGPFKRYFQHSVPTLLRDNVLGNGRSSQRNTNDEGPQEVLDKLLVQVQMGGAYSAELFRAMHQAMAMSREPGIKPDPDMKPRASGNATNHQATVISAVDGSNDGGYLFIDDL